MDRVYLKIKIKSLAEEARIIRLEERKSRTQALRTGLIDHRKGIVRREARHSLLLYGFMRDWPYSALEDFTKDPPNWSKIQKMGIRFHADEEPLKKWCVEGASWATRETTNALDRTEQVQPRSELQAAC
jgi:hypothetical protein